MLMAHTRRRFLLGAAAGALTASPVAGAEPRKQIPVEDLDRVLAAPVLKLDSLEKPVIVASMELLRNGRTYLLRTRSADGAEAITVPHPAKTADVYPFVLRSVLPVFVGKDARQVERLLWDVYRHADNYKMQGIALWVGVAAAEMGLLELMGRVANRPVADFFGGAVRRDIPVYYASGVRGNTPEQEVEHLQKLAAGSGVKALKFRLRGRMSRNADSLPGRTEKLIALTRQTFGSGMTL